MCVGVVLLTVVCSEVETVCVMACEFWDTLFEAAITNLMSARTDDIIGAEC